jgi:ribose transport system substrate-binding protein
MSARRTRILIAAALMLPLTACGAGENSAQPATATCGKTYRVDDYPIPICGPLKLAVFFPGTNNADLQARISYLKQEIPKIKGASMTIFDGKFNATTQINQIENALESHRYNAAIAAPVDGVLACSALSKRAPAAGMLVVVPNLALCDRTANEGAALRAPGTLTYVGGTQTPSYWKDYLTWIADQNPGPQQYLALTDPAAPFPLTANFDKAVEEVRKTHPDFKIVGEAATDLTVAGSFQKASALIQAHPDATGLVTMFSTETQGAVQALRAAGKTGKFKIYDKGATPWAVEALSSGQITATSPERAVTSTATMLRAILDARQGKHVQPFYGNDGASMSGGTSTSGLVVYTAATVGSYQGQG